jgi:hypothetical protein
MLAFQGEILACYRNVNSAYDGTKAVGLYAYVLFKSSYTYIFPFLALTGLLLSKARQNIEDKKT